MGGRGGRDGFWSLGNFWSLGIFWSCNRCVIGKGLGMWVGISGMGGFGMGIGIGLYDGLCMKWSRGL
jgi:hypothetical protein